MLSHLLRVSLPGARARPAPTCGRPRPRPGYPTARLIDLALYAPQWAGPVEDALGWPGLADGVLWLHAHTKDRQWSVDPELRDSWAAETAERTPLSADDLVDGAVDVDWFRRAHDALGAERWTVLHKAARHASSGTGHRRAQLYAERDARHADRGRAAVARITGKRNQDAVRALGLLPLPADAAVREPRSSRHRYAIAARVRAGQQAVRRAAAGQREDRGRGSGWRTWPAPPGTPTRCGSPGRSRRWQAADLADGPVSRHGAATSRSPCR